MSMMASKLVYVYLVTYVEEEWTKYREEIEELHITVGNFSVSTCERDVNVIRECET